MHVDRGQTTSDSDCARSASCVDAFINGVHAVKEVQSAASVEVKMRVFGIKW